MDPRGPGPEYLTSNGYGIVVSNHDGDWSSVDRWRAPGESEWIEASSYEVPSPLLGDEKEADFEAGNPPMLLKGVSFWGPSNPNWQRQWHWRTTRLGQWPDGSRAR